MHSYSSANVYKPITHHHLAVCGSTNSELLHRLANEKIDNSEPYLLTATTQTAGRGQRSRSWQSPIGNIYLSLYHPLQVPISGLLSLVVGYHLTRLPIIQQINRLRHVAKLPLIGVKWANDIGYYQHDALPESDTNTPNAINFNKLAGILIEPVVTNNQITGVVVGVGINIEIAPRLSAATKEGMDYQAISLTQIIEETHLALAQHHNKSGPSGSGLYGPGLDVSKASFSNPNLLSAEDLYRPVSATLLRAINQFIDFSQIAYSLPRFIKEYSAVNVLSGRQLQIIQQPLSNATQTKVTGLNSPTAEPLVLEGEVMGLNEDGSLKLNVKDKNELIDVYAGTIRLLK